MCKFTTLLYHPQAFLIRLAPQKFLPDHQPILTIPSRQWIPHKMNIWQQFNLANQSFLSDWRILYWQMLHVLGNKKENLVVLNLADFCNLPNRQNKFYTKFSSYVYGISKLLFPKPNVHGM